MTAPTHALSCGAKSSHVPQFGLIPYLPLCKLAARFEVGREKYIDPWQYRKGLGDKEYTIERAQHVIDHAYRIIAKLQGDIPEDGEDDAAAIMWGGVVLSESMEVINGVGEAS